MNTNISKATLQRLAQESGLYFIDNYWPDFAAVCWPSARDGYYDVIVKWHHNAAPGENLRTRQGYPLDDEKAMPDMLMVSENAHPIIAQRAAKFIHLLLIEG